MSASTLRRLHPPIPSRFRRGLVLALLCLAIGGPAGPREAGATDPALQALVDQVTEARLAEIVLRLQNFQTRYSRSDSVHRAADWIIAEFQSFGYAPEDIFQHPFTVSIGGMPYPQRNIVVTKLGTTRPDDIIVIGGHYDTVSNQPLVSAPGADDDGSGTAAVMVIAEILAQVNLEATVMFATWAAEEQGFVGSTAWVSYAIGQGYGIDLYMNIDACGYQGDPDNVVKLFSNPQSMAFNTTMRDLCLKFTDLAPIIVNPIAFSDHVPFQNAGIPFTYSIEEDITPFIHTPNDLLSTMDMAYYRKIVATNLASLATFAELIPATGVDEPPLAAVPGTPLLTLAGPNPVTGPASFAIGMREASPAVRLAIYDALGRHLDTVLDGPLAAGQTRAVWEGRNGGGAAPAGVYFARLTAAGKPAETLRLVVTR
jgi:aminopeptidase YwaD